MQVTRTLYYPGYIREGKRYNLPTSDYYFDSYDCFKSDDFKKASQKGDPFVFKKEAVFIVEGDGMAFDKELGWLPTDHEYIFEKFVDEKPSEYASNVIELPITKETFLSGAEFRMPGSTQLFKYESGVILISDDGIAWSINLILRCDKKTVYGFSYKLLGTEVEFELKFPL